ncbi:MAG: cupin domain-containing protein [Clostridiales bacterium]|nr:cupin domain-containing protein [Clostridiales bacterium]
MVGRTEDRRVEQRANMRGGNGSVEVAHLFDETQSLGKTRMTAQLTFPVGASIGSHTHDPEAELFIVVSGEATVTDNGEVHTLRPGDVMFTGGGGEHSVENRGLETLVLYAVIFN